MHHFRQIQLTVLLILKPCLLLMMPLSCLLHLVGALIQAQLGLLVLQQLPYSPAGSGVASSQVDTAVDAIAPSVTAAAMIASFTNSYNQEIMTSLPGMLLPPTEPAVLPVQSASRVSISVAPGICAAMVLPGGISDAASCDLESYTEAKISPMAVAGVPLPPTCTVAQIPSVAAHSHATTVAPSISDVMTQVHLLLLAMSRHYQQVLYL